MARNAAGGPGQPTPSSLLLIANPYLSLCVTITGTGYDTKRPHREELVVALAAVAVVQLVPGARPVTSTNKQRTVSDVNERAVDSQWRHSASSGQSVASLNEQWTVSGVTQQAVDSQ